MNSQDTFTIRDWRQQLFRRVDIASIVYFRIAFGLLMLWETVGEFERLEYLRFWSEPLPVMYFKYYGFEWVHAWPSTWGMELHFWVLRLLSVFIIIGFFYRTSMFLFFLGITYFFLLDQSMFQNHLYLVCWISFAMIFVPANRCFSVDAWLRKSIRSDTTPAWTVATLAALMGVAYFYGGVAKINPDWLQGWPLRGWLPKRFPDLAEHEWFVYFMSYGAIMFELLVVPLLIWRKSRNFAFCVCIIFNLTNRHMFAIGVFPFTSIAITAMFLSSSWPRRWVNWVRRKAGLSVHEMKPIANAQIPSSLSLRQTCTVTLITVCLAFHLLFPLRHFLYPGFTLWTDEGYRFSWQMMLRRQYSPIWVRNKRSDNGYFHVTVTGTDPSTGLPLKPITTIIDPAKHLVMLQCFELGRRSDMILQFAHYLKNKAKEAGFTNIIVTADFKTSLNGREAQYFIDPKVNLAEVSRNLWHADWIVPLSEPLPDVNNWDKGGANY